MSGLPLHRYVQNQYFTLCSMNICACCMLPALLFLQDVALPFIRDDRFEKDTLFLVFENDFRFHPDDHMPPRLLTLDDLREVGAAPSAAQCALPVRSTVFA